MLSRGISILLLAIMAACCHADARMLKGGAGAPLTNQNDLMVGAGGFLAGQSVGNDGTMVVYTDTYGAYKWCDAAHSAGCTYTTAPNGTAGVWQQLVTPSSMPVAFAANGQGYNHGVFALAVCYGTPSTMYMVFDVYNSNTTSTVYKSVNSGQNWTATGFTPTTTFQNPNNSTRDHGPRLAIDPNNCNNVIVGTQNTGDNNVQYTQNGGTTWSTVTTGAGGIAASNGNGYTGMLINPGNSNVAYVYSQGQGTYQTTTGLSGTWTKLTAGSPPTNIANAAIDANTGIYYASDQTNAFTWNGSTWTKVITGTANDANVAAICVDPNLSGHAVAIANHGEINELLSGTWSGFSSTSITISTTGDIPWVTSLGAGVVTPVDCYFDASVAKTLHINTVNAFFTNSPWSGNISGATQITWNAQGRGVEQLVGVSILSTPQYSTPFVSSWDRSGFFPNLTNYPSAIIPGNNTNLNIGYSIDYDPTLATNTVCYYSDGAEYGDGSTTSGCSINGTSWTSFPNLPSTVYPTNTNNAQVGNIAMSSATEIILATSAEQPQYTTNATAGTITWNNIGACTGVAAWTNFLNGSTFGGSFATRDIAADKVTAHTYYMYVNGVGFFTLTGSGATCTAGSAITSVPGGGASFTASVQMQTVPGIASEYWVAVGQSGNPGQGQPPNNVAGLAYTTNGGGAFTAVTNMNAATSVSFGLHAPGQSHPAVYVAGWYSTSLTSQSFTIANSGTATINVGAGLGLTANTSLYFANGANQQWASVQTYNNATGALTMNLASSTGSGTFSSWTFKSYGIWQCTVSCNASSTPAWTQIVGWPGNTFDVIEAISGDVNIYNRVYVGFGGSGFAKYNFLLKRDLDPSANDNDPMFLEKAA